MKTGLRLLTNLPFLWLMSAVAYLLLGIFETRVFYFIVAAGNLLVALMSLRRDRRDRAAQQSAESSV